MRITESKFRQILKEEARRVLREGFDDQSGLPTDRAGIESVYQKLMAKSKSMGLEPREDILLRYMLTVAVNSDDNVQRVLDNLKRNRDFNDKELGVTRPNAAAAASSAPKANAPTPPVGDDEASRRYKEKVAAMAAKAGKGDDANSRYRQKLLQAMASGQTDFSNFPGPDED